jgi:Tfp pilus assembly protein FimT
MAVMVVVGVLAGAAVVSVSSSSGNRSTMAAKQLLRDMTFARQRAVATGTPTWVEFNTVAQTWTIRAEVAGGDRATAYILTDPGTNAGFVQELDAGQYVGVQLTTVDFDTEDWVGFDWLGRPLDKSGEATPLTADGSVVFTDNHQITVDRATGHITYVPPP